jgi:tetratricopeptide (TPR) repeat protein/tRNA G46 methylase TrmB
METLEQALQHHRAGRFEDAEALYCHILESEPNQPEALHWLGVMELQRGHCQKAVELIQRALVGKPEYAEAHNNLGLALQEQQHLSEAESAFREALRYAPADAVVHLNLGFTLKCQGKLTEAAGAFERACALSPDNAEALNEWGMILRALNRLPQAIAAFERAVASHPDAVQCHRNLADALRADGRLDAAVLAYREVVRLKPDLAQALLDLGFALHALANAEEAVETFREACRLRPQSIDARRGLAATLQMLAPVDYQPALEADLKACFAAPQVDAQELAGLAANQLLHKYRLPQRLTTDLQGLLRDLAADELLHALLTRTVNVNCELEQVLTILRQRLFFDLLHAEQWPGSYVDLIATIGLQCFNNEYIFDTTADEEQALDELRRRCERLVTADTPSPPLECCVALLAMYVPLHTLAFAQALAAPPLPSWFSPMRSLIQRTLQEPLEERALALEIESLSDIDDPTSIAVRAHYEEHPYPRWLELPRVGKTNLRRHLQELFTHFSPPDFFDGRERMLIAGCGTGREPIAIALACELGEIVAVDLSRSSLAYARRMAAKLGANNIRFLHGDILAMSQLQQRFHVVECGGVLHHMQDPLRGWRVLVDRVMPGGLMKIGLYSERARAAEALARAEIDRRGLKPCNRDIKAFRGSILRGEARQSLLELADGLDFYTLSACRDLLFHSTEHRFTLPEIEQALSDLGLSFVGFDLPRPHVRQRYRELYPHDTQQVDLRAWDRFEQQYPQAFAGMYVFWCQKTQGTDHKLGRLVRGEGTLTGVAPESDRAVELESGNAEAHNDLGMVLREQGRFDEAIAAFKQAVTLNPVSAAEAHYQLGVTWEMLDEPERAIEAFSQALRVEPNLSVARHRLIPLLRFNAPDRYWPQLEGHLKLWFSAADINPRHLARFTATQLGYKYRLQKWLASPNWDVRALLNSLGRDPLLLAMLRTAINVDPDLELALTAMRRTLLDENGSASTAHQDLSIAIALQCFSNEYVFAVQDDEMAIVDMLQVRCGSMIATQAKPSSNLETCLSLIAMYRPIHLLDCAVKLGAVALQDWSMTIQPLIERTLLEPLEEQVIEKSIEVIGQIDDTTSQVVRAQYEEHPYPRWLSLSQFEPLELGRFLERCFPHFAAPAFLNEPNTRLLVAGCGTGSEPLVMARTHPHARIVAIDLSRRSLAYASRMARKFEVLNVRFLHGDILNLYRLDERFHAIVCVGVLHHMAEPLQGWRALTNVLLPGGVMQIGLYSELAREGVVAARKRIRQHGLRSVADDIRAFRKQILSGSDNALVDLAKSEDLYTLSTCRDLLFHVSEHRFTLTQVEGALSDLGLRFIGFDLSLFAAVRQRYRELCPEDPQMTDLSAWARFEAQYPGTFSGMYTFWCQKSQGERQVSSGKL